MTRADRAYARRLAEGQAGCYGSPVRAAAIDLGKVRVGLAVSDELGLMAHPRPHLDGGNMGRVVEQLSQLAAAEGIEVFILGLPRTLDGREGPPARRAKDFGKRLRDRSGVRVVLLDERLTTKEAHERLAAGGLNSKERRERVDSASAALMLQAFLESTRRGP